MYLKTLGEHVVLPKQYETNEDSPLSVVSTPFGWTNMRVRIAVHVILKVGSPVRWYPIFGKGQKAMAD
jgi:hypothetical protein